MSFCCSNPICSEQTNADFEWSTCKHKYCKACATKIVNDSLSYLNEIPRCIVPNCEAILKSDKTQQIRSNMLQRYVILFFCWLRVYLLFIVHIACFFLFTLCMVKKRGGKNEGRKRGIQKSFLTKMKLDN